MNCWKNIFAVGLLAVSTHSFAEVYYHIGGGLDNVKHDKSDANYTLVGLKGGIGFKMSDSYDFEFDITPKLSTKNSGSGTCFTTINTTVACTKDQEISRLMTVGSIVYNTEINTTKAFIKAGVGLVQSSFRSVYTSPQANSLVENDESDSDTVAVLSAGIIRNERHRMGLIVSSSYGNSTIGSFQFMGFEYNYLIFGK